MLILGIILIVLAVAGFIWGSLSIFTKAYNHPFASPDTVNAVCKSHVKPLGTPAGDTCGLLIKNHKGESISCRKGVVESVANGGEQYGRCVVAADYLGPGLVAGSVLVLLAGIVCLSIKSTTHHRMKHDAKRK